jgi:hypothetical protein
MEPALADGPDPMDWTVGEAASVPPAVDFLNQLPVPPAAEYSAFDWNFFLPLGPEPHMIQADELLQFNSYPRMVASQDMWASWQEVDAMMFDSTHDNTFGNPGYGSPSRALSVGSRHLSIGSGASSNHSWSSWRGRSRIKKVFSRTSSIAGRAKRAMKEGMSSWSLNGAKEHVSPSPRRTGKLTDVARAGMRLLKGQGACWKCKILKKSVRKTSFWPSLYQADNLV